jgi:hypothetical protein
MQGGLPLAQRKTSQQEQTMHSTVRAGLIGAGIGGASMFLLDPDRGARRRTLVLDKTASMARKTRDVGQRLSSLQSRARSRFSDRTAALVAAGIVTGAVALTAAVVARRGNGADRAAAAGDEIGQDVLLVTEIDVLTIDTVPSDSGPFDTEGM